MTQARADAALVPGDSIFWYHRTRIAELATRARLPRRAGRLNTQTPGAS